MSTSPILLITPMVQATLGGNKTKTRRTKGLEIINECPNDWQFEWADFSLKKPWRFTYKPSVNKQSLKDKNFTQEAIKCPYGKVGDVLWVRETWQHVDVEDFTGYVYKASGVGQEWEMSNDEWKWKPSIFMPKEACRLFLKITNIRVERLQDISEADAIAEGVEENVCTERLRASCNSSLCKKECTGKGEYFRYPVNFDDEPCYSAVESFQTLWQSINGKENWDANPWVWVISFEKTERPEGFLKN